MQLLQFLQINVRGAIQNGQGQDLIEYALMAGFVALAAGVSVPGIATGIGTICSSIADVLALAALPSGQGVF
jgi:hypothetical protein